MTAFVAGFFACFISAAFATDFFCRHPWKPTALWGVQLASPLYIAVGLKKLLNLILEGQVRRLALTHKDRFLRFGAELVFAICEAKEGGGNL